MTASQIPINGHPAAVDSHTPRRIRRTPRIHGKSRVPGQEAIAFDLHAFSRALEQHDVDYQLAPLRTRCRHSDRRP